MHLWSLKTTDKKLSAEMGNCKQKPHGGLSDVYFDGLHSCTFQGKSAIIFISKHC